jgi:putative ABC transport system permease protein
MRWFKVILARVRGLFRREAVLEDIEEEMRIHIEFETQTNIERGMTPETARLAAMKHFGNLGRIKDLAYDVRGGGLFETLWQDLRHAARTLRQKPGFAIVALLTLGIGISANTAIFSMINAVLLRPLPYSESDRLLFVGHSWGGGVPRIISSLNYLDCRDRNQVFESTALYLEWGANLSGIGQPERLTGLQVSASFFSTIKTQPFLGRAFSPEEDRPGQEQVVILGYGLWQRRFGGDPNILGHDITLDDKSYSIIGVAPADLRLFSSDPVEVIKPGAPSPEMSKHHHRQWETFEMIARLKPGITLSQAQDDLKAVAEQIREENPEWYPPESQWSLAALPLQESLFGDLHRPLFLLWSAVGLVLLIACANVANLSLARAASRRKEFSIRLALGANRLRLIRQLLTESLLLSLIGGGLGCLLSLWAIQAFTALDPTRIFQTVRVQPDSTVLSFSLVISLLTGILFGLFPALRYSKTNLALAIKEGGQQHESLRLRSPRSILVITEVALSMILLTGAGLLLRSFDRMLRVNPGFEAQGVLALDVSLPEFKYKTDAQINSFYHQALARIDAIPGVDAVAMTNNPPLSKSISRNVFSIEGLSFSATEQPSGTSSGISPDFLQTMKIPLLTGRGFTDQDATGAPGVVIIDELLAQRYFAGRSPIGQRISIGKAPWREIVGVVGHIKHDALDEGSGDPQYYYPVFQGEQESGTAFMIRSSVDPGALLPAVQSAIQEIDPDQPVFGVTSMTQNLNDAATPRRFLSLLLAVFAGTALVLAATGLYGLIAYSVSQRTREIGTRMALGAGRQDVLKLVLKGGIALASIGIALGMAGAYLLTRLMTTLLYEVTPTDPATFALVPAALLIVAIVACYLPARRAAAVDPMIALRTE